MFLSQKLYSSTHLRIAKDNISDHTLEIPFIFPRYPGTLIHISFHILTKTYLHMQISTPLLIMYSLHSLSPSDIPGSHLPTLLASLRLCLEVAGPTGSLISALHLQWRDAAQAIVYENIYYHLYLLEKYLSNEWESPRSRGSQGQEPHRQNWRENNENAMAKARDDWLVDDLIALSVCAELELQTQGHLKPSTSD